MFDIGKSSTELESSGVWTTFGDSQFLIAHTNNISFQREFARLQAPYKKKIDRGTLDPKIQLDIMCKAMGKFIVLNWKDVTLNGEVVEYSPELAAEGLKNNSDFREFVQDFSTNLDNYREEDIDDMGKS